MDAIRYVALGDSYTIGTGLNESPSALARAHRPTRAALQGHASV
jgi:hypothetical protein